MDISARSLALDPHQSFIVQAPAGSGKTELLTQRFLKLLACVERAPEEILAVTFTRKAAAEMRQRIMNALERATDPTVPVNPHEKITWEIAREVLQRDEKLQWHLQQNPNRLRIVTIDALCAYIVNRMPILSQCGAGLEIIDYPQRYYQQAVEWLLVKTTDEKWFTSLTCLLKHLDNRIETLSSLLISLLAKRDQWLCYLANMQHQEMEHYLNASLVKIIHSHLEALQEALFPYQAELIPLLQHAAMVSTKQGIANAITECQHLTTLPPAKAKYLPEWHGIVELLVTQQATWRKSFTEKNGFLSPSAANKEERKSRKETKEQMLALMGNLSDNDKLLTLLAEIRSLPPSAISENQKNILNAIGDLLPVLVAYLQVIFQEIGKVDFIEVSLRAIQALGDELSPSDIALSLDYQFRHILIDEYQDTSVMQYRLFEKLIMGWQPGDGRTLFLVGDPMQSIYRFRGAEVSLFLHTQQHGLGHFPLTSLRLQVNFRSNQHIIHWINQAFSHIFPKVEQINLGAVTYSQAFAHKNKEGEQSVYFHAVKCQDQAQCVLQLVNNTFKKNPQENIGILVRAKKHLALIIQWLKREQIPFIAHEVEHLHTRSHVIDLLSLLRAISDWTDLIAWYAVLRAPWLGISLSDLLVLAKNHQGLLWVAIQNFEDYPELSLDAKNRLKKFVPIMNHWLAERKRRPLCQFLKGLWLAIGGAQCYSQPHFIQDIDKTLALIEESSVGWEILNINVLEARLSELYGDVLPLSPLALNNKTGVVELMTIHKAKGLEFNTVIMPHLEARTINHEQSLLLWFERSHNAGVDLILATRKAYQEDHDLLYRYVDRQIRQKNQFESARLLYVGATRAKETLHLIGALSEEENPAAGSFLAMLAPQIQKPFIKHDVYPLQEVQIPTEKMPDLRRLPLHWSHPSLLEQHLHSQLEKMPDLSPNVPLAGDLLAQSAGTVFHRILQHWMSQLHLPLAVTTNTKQGCLIALKRFGLTDQALSEANELVILALESMLRDPKGRWILNPAHTERKSEWQLSYRSGKEIYNEIIDCAFVDKDNVRWIVDYKLTQTMLDGTTLQQETEKYRQQLLKYQQTLMRLENRVIRCGLYFPLSQIFWEMTEVESSIQREGIYV